METCVVLLAILLRWTVSLHPYSGQGKPPMHGDFEAQRHWMEVTYQLPVTKWYENSTSNDLLYWGLDYPPLTAYHSLLCGHFANKIDPQYVELFSSRGIETEDHKLFMRGTVILVDILIFMSGFIKLFHSLGHKEKKLSYFTLGLLYPGLVLVDHGHFQYNCVSLGLMIWAVYFLKMKKLLKGSVMFVMALNYKQMELYHAFPIFWFILRQVQIAPSNFQKLINLSKVALVVIISFFIIWSPFLSDMDRLKQVVHRIFPINRGLFEDKVANFWCAISVLFKVHMTFEKEVLAKICFIVTGLGTMSTCLHLYLKPTFRNFQLCLINCSLVFFLFSYHVHEKSILLAAIPVLLYLPSDPFACFWFLQVSTFSMVTLMIKDNLFLPYLSLFIAYSCLGEVLLEGKMPKKKVIRVAYLLSMLGCLGISLTHNFVAPPVRYPDLWSLGAAEFSFFHFVGFLIYFHANQLQLSFK